MLRVRQASRCCTDLRLRLAHLVVGWWRPASAAWPGGLAYGYSFQWLLGAGPTRHVSNAYWEGVLLVRGEKDLSLCIGVPRCALRRSVHYVSIRGENTLRNYLYSVFEDRTYSGDSSVGRASD